VCQKQLETVVPRPGDMVLMLRGPQKMQRARLMQKDNKVIHNDDDNHEHDNDANGHHPYCDALCCCLYP
jgi:hypothetical protein